MIGTLMLGGFGYLELCLYERKVTHCDPRTSSEPVLSGDLYEILTVKLAPVPLPVRSHSRARATTQFYNPGQTQLFPLILWTSRFLYSQIELTGNQTDPAFHFIQNDESKYLNFICQINYKGHKVFKFISCCVFIKKNSSCTSH